MRGMAGMADASSGSDVLGTSTSGQNHDTGIFLAGGLVAMLALVIAALLILACSFRRQARSSARIANGEEVRENQELDRVEDDGAGKGEVLVIMAGDDKPTFLARPVAGHERRASSPRPGNSGKEEGKETKGSEEVIP
ncbi:hypothetical protein MLD38_014113 [Melastoma candidum]|uniref:Uncharacterized protein n=1 Tax=Melastoma candidum TaxID=119954 RepID=A0ACB9RFX1_9MYRT|nr:hypothetical protein MLD38_014113 [Melastoma candidum]